MEHRVAPPHEARVARHRALVGDDRVADGLVLLWTAVWFVGNATRGGSSWHFFVTGQEALSGAPYLAGGSLHRTGGGLHLYATLPVLQIGPLALAAAWLLCRFLTVLT